MRKKRLARPQALILIASLIYPFTALGDVAGAATSDAPGPMANSGPQASAHQHLLSPAVATLWSTPVQPPIPVPGEIDALLSARSQAFGDAAGLAALYVEDAQLTNSSDPGWVHGRSEVARKAASAFSRPYAVTPVSYRSHGDGAQLAGYLTRTEQGEPHHFGQVLLVLRSQDGHWKIESEALVFPGPTILAPFDADDLIAQLDEAGVRTASVLSVAYTYGDPRRQVENEDARVVEENDWTIAEASRFPARLFAFCGMSPLRPDAIRELDRCARNRQVAGIKLHLGNSGVSLRDARHVEALARLFARASRRRLPIVVHLKTRGPAYGREDAAIFLDKVLPAAKGLPVQVAHLAGSGPGYPEFADQAMSVLADAVAANDARAATLYFDVTTVVTEATSAEEGERIARRIRQVGTQRVLFGADLSMGDNPSPAVSWKLFTSKVPLTADEFAAIARNTPPIRARGTPE